jgi:PAS domain S-box-containing protein
MGGCMGPQQPEWVKQVSGLLNAMNQGVIISDAEDRIVFANDLFLEMIKRSAEEVIGHTAAELYHVEDRVALMERISHRRREGRGLYDFFIRQSDGNKLPVMVTAKQTTCPNGGMYALITATDITAQKQAEAALREANEQLEKRHKEIEEDLLLAARVQQSLAPNRLTWGGVAVETFYQPVRTIGGDFGLVAPREDALHMLVCDVSGHGIGSALIANRIYTETMSQIESGAPLGSMMAHLNRFVMGSIAGSVFYFTMAAARLNREGHRLEFAGAGHPPAMLARPGKEPQLLESRSAVLGLLADAVDGEAVTEIPVETGDRVVIYTDGFSESFNSRREMLGVDGLAEIVKETSKLPLGDMKHEMIERVAAWRGGPADDDMSLVVVEVN